MKITIEAEPELAGEIARGIRNHAGYLRGYQSNTVAFEALGKVAQEIDAQVQRKPPVSEKRDVQEKRKRG